MMNRQEETTLVPVEEAARELGITALAVLMQVKRERLEGIEREGRWFVTGASLASFQSGVAGAGQAICRTACAQHKKCGGCP